MSHAEFCVAISTVYLIAAGFTEKPLSVPFVAAGILWAVVGLVVAFLP